MQFVTRKRRQAPAVIIVSLIDILIVLLIFLMVTSTFKQRPSVKLTLPESREARPGTSEDKLVVTIRSEQPYFYFKTRPVTFEKLQQELAEEARTHAGVGLTIDADKGATIENTLRVIDAAKAARIEKYSLSARQPAAIQ
ncbi:MAG: biopolymer transporter ExbD [Pedosphaera sp.]|nr:biopolymer transporter ExbD [Pedosphaera sp.]